MKENMNRTFSTGANRNSLDGKYDIEAFFSPQVLEARAAYMHKHRYLADGTLRDGDNWQKLFGDDHYSVCMKSLMRHILDMWLEHRGCKSRDGMEEAINGAMFNLEAYYYKFLKEKNEKN